MVNDESIILDAAEMRALSKALRSLKRSAQDTAPLWSFTQAVFYERFHTCCRMAGLQQTVHSYQVRHGAASEDALSKRRTLAEIQERHGYQEVQERYRVPGGASQGGPQSDRLRAGNGTGSCRRLRRQEGTSNPTNSNQITGAGDTFGSCSLPSGQALRKRLNFLLRQALSSSSYGQVFLDVFFWGAQRALPCADTVAGLASMWTSEFAQPGTLPTAGLSNTSAGGSSLVWFAASSLLGRVRHGRLLLAALTGVPTSSGAGQSCLTTWHGECSWGTVPSRLRPQLSAAQWPMPCQLSARILAAAWHGRWARCANFFRLGHAAWCTLTNVNMALGGRRPRLLLVGALAPLPASWP